MPKVSGRGDRYSLIEAMSGIHEQFLPRSIDGAFKESDARVLGDLPSLPSENLVEGLHTTYHAHAGIGDLAI